ncbi:MAG: ATP-binding protein [Deltaproteobacteria bacterium]|nr:ATP-binding protein [Deltaproteobacteria bacterium]
MYTRDLAGPLGRQKRSVLLLGPRQTGKSTLVRGLRPELEINLAHEPTFLEFASNPRELEQRLAAARPRTVFIDEVQRLPSLLNTLQALLDGGSRTKFLLTGSSARKLKRGRANLLPGRVVSFNMGPLTSRELGDAFRLTQALEEGLLPGIYAEPERAQRRRVLQTYASTYLREEVQAEALTRRIEGFSRFLNAAAARSGQLLDFAKLAASAAVPRQSAIRYFEILEDTLLARRVEPWTQNATVRTVKHPRFYFFDTGVLNGLLRTFSASAPRIGSLFEHFILHELVQRAENAGVTVRVDHYRTEGGAEVDFVVTTETGVFALECKATGNLGAGDVRHLRAFREAYGGKLSRLRCVLLHTGNTAKAADGIEVLPWAQGLAEVGVDG